MLKLKDGFKGQRTIILPSFIVENTKKDPLGRLLYITDIGFYPMAAHHYRQRTAIQATEYILIYCIKGEGWFSIGNQRYTVSGNQFFILPRHVAHAYGCNEDNPWSIYWIHFSGEIAQSLCKGLDKPTDTHAINGGYSTQQLNLFEEIYQSLDSGFSHNNIMYATSILFHFLGQLKYPLQFAPNSKENQRQDVIDLAISYMQENLAQRLLLNQIASAVKLSVSYFSRLFYKKTGIPPLQYLNMIRIRKACQYLDETNMKIYQIAPLVGIEDNLYFSRLFSKIMGITPTEYRNNKKG